MQVGPFARQEVVNDSTGFWILAGAEEPDRFVEGDIDLPACADGLTFDGHLLAVRVNFGPQFTDDLVVDSDLALQDQSFGGTPRRDAGIGKKLLKADGRPSSKLKADCGSRPTIG